MLKLKFRYIFIYIIFHDILCALGCGFSIGSYCNYVPHVEISSMTSLKNDLFRVYTYTNIYPIAKDHSSISMNSKGLSSDIAIAYKPKDGIQYINFYGDCGLFLWNKISSNTYFGVNLSSQYGKSVLYNLDPIIDFSEYKHAEDNDIFLLKGSYRGVCFGYLLRYFNDSIECIMSTGPNIENIQASVIKFNKMNSFIDYEKISLQKVGIKTSFWVRLFFSLDVYSGKTAGVSCYFRGYFINSSLLSDNEDIYSVNLYGDNVLEKGFRCMKSSLSLGIELLFV